jgi:hypothetical protein
VAQNGDLGVFFDVADQFVGSAGDDEVDEGVLREEGGDCIACFHELD